MSKIDSINVLRKLSRNSKQDLEGRLLHAKNAVRLSKELKLDSTILKSNINLSFMYLNLDNLDLFRSTNHENLKLAQKLKDSMALGTANRSLGWYHAQVMNNDSAYHYYYNAEKIYYELKDIRNQGEVLLNMADIQEIAKDYKGSEETAVEAIRLIESLPKNDRTLDVLWKLYNLLAVISERLEKHNEAIKNYNECINIAKDMSDPLYFNLNTKNNIGFSYSQMGDYSKALSIYEELISDERLIDVDPELYPTVLGNIAYTRFLKKDSDVEGIEEQFKLAYKISDSLNYSLGLMEITKDMAEFYFSIDKKDSAFLLSKENYKLGKETNSNDIVLKSLKLMSDIEGGSLGKYYLDEYIKLNDSLVQNERAARDKFARIEFDTDKIEENNLQLSKERQLLLLISIGLLISLTLLYVIISQRAKNRKLKFIQQQQETNEEIYNLMLTQQDKVEEGRTHEKKRISEELHDGILGKLFGTRLSLDSLNLVQTEDAAKSRSQYIDQLKTIEAEIRKISHDLNSDFIADSSFIDIVKALVETQTAAYNLKYEFLNDNDIDWEEIPNKTKIHIYRMLQETMQNIYKHANATLVKISFQLKNNVILCTIEDDGSGFNVNKARKGIGLKNINSRINEIEGKVEVYSKIDIGTIIKIFIPVK
ncbi:tetratricopeptide repeat protein [Pontimicrobium sp. SW4]|uniref:histidine kinase n=1 Tax=Pontimicrobium sp. SW4 TaxID=3153519 RepID=A0AAU7BSX3_9FLAO